MEKQPTHAYEPLKRSEEEIEDGPHEGPTSRPSPPRSSGDTCSIHPFRSKTRHPFSWPPILSLLILVVTTAFYLTSPAFSCLFQGSQRTRLTAPLTSLPSNSTGNTTCGTTPSQALTAGCVFDPMSFVWTQPACYDAVLAEEFLSLGHHRGSQSGWKWYHDREGLLYANETLVLRGVFASLHVSWEYHRQHCVFMLRKMQRAVAGGKSLDGYVAEVGHTKHCLGRLDVKGVDGEKVNTEIVRKFVRCPADG